MSEASIIISGAGLFILYTVTVLGGAAWLNTQFKNMKLEIIADFTKKHDENAVTVKALEKLVIRHDIMLNPEFSEVLKNGRAHHG